MSSDLTTARCAPAAFASSMRCASAVGLLLAGALLRDVAVRTSTYVMVRDDDSPLGSLVPHAASRQHWGSDSLVAQPPAHNTAHNPSNITATPSRLAAKAENAEVGRSRLAAARCAQLTVHEPTQVNLTGRRGYCSVVLPELTNGAWHSSPSFDKLVSSFDCARDDAGQLATPSAVHISGSRFRNACAETCRSCTRCRYISISVPARRCLWFARCDLDDLRPSRHGEQWTSWAVSSPSIGGALPSASLHARNGHSPVGTSPSGSLSGRAQEAAADERSLLGSLRGNAPQGNAPRPSPREARAAYRVGLATLLVQKLPEGQRSADDDLGGGASATKWGCSLLGWCQSARRLREALPPLWTVELLILTTAATQSTQALADCPELIVTLVPPELRQAARWCAQQLMGPNGWLGRVRTGGKAGSAPLDPYRPGGGDPHGITLFKWALLSLHSYDAILFADLDVDLFPDWRRALSIRQWWERWMPRLVSHPSTRFISAPDHEAPFNIGTFLLAPRNTSAIYQDGLAVLRRCDFSDTDGWAAVGPLRSLRRPKPRPATTGRGGAGSAGGSTSGAAGAGVRPAAGGVTGVASGVDSGHGWGDLHPGMVVNAAARSFEAITCFPPPESKSTSGALDAPRPPECSLAYHPITQLRSWSFVTEAHTMHAFSYMCMHSMHQLRRALCVVQVCICAVGPGLLLRSARAQAPCRRARHVALATSNHSLVWSQQALAAAEVVELGTPQAIRLAAGLVRVH